jgi:hypothetical protein
MEAGEQAKKEQAPENQAKKHAGPDALAALETAARKLDELASSAGNRKERVRLLADEVRDVRGRVENVTHDLGSR